MKDKIKEKKKGKNLAQNYIYATTRHLSKKIREDVEKELDGLISDMLEERGDGNIRAVLTELGTPEDLAAKYSGDEQKFLISGVYFVNYKRVLKLVVPIVCGAILLGIIISAITEIVAGIEGNPALFALRVFGQTLAGIVGGAWQTFAIITVIFAVLERSKANLNSYGDNFLDALPEAPKKTEKISIGESIFGIVFSILVAILLLSAPQVFGAWMGDVWIPMFNTDVLRSLWFPIIAWTVLGIISEIVTILEGRHTKRIAVMNLVTNLLIAGCASVVFLHSDIMNPVFLQTTVNAIENHWQNVPMWLAYTNVIIFAIICIVLFAESIGTIVKSWKYDKS